MEDGDKDKTEEASAFKLQQARRKGNVARGPDLGFMTSLGTLTGFAWLTGGGFVALVAHEARDALVSAALVLESPEAILRVMGMVLSSVLQPLAYLLGAVFVIVLVFELAQTGVVFSGTPLKPDLSRLDPSKGFKRLFSVRMLVETGKNLLKLAVYTAIAGMVILSAFRLAPAIVDARRLVEATGGQVLRLMSFAVLAAAGFVVLDQLIVRRGFLKQMRMSRREQKREHRDREGEPRMKQRRRQLHGEFAKMSRSLRDLRGADVMVVNPIHYAVALRYEDGLMDAPKVVARGSHQFALRLKRLAFIHGVRIVTDPPLARALYRGTDLGQQIPEASFQRVADIYLKLRAERATPTGSAHV